MINLHESMGPGRDRTRDTWISSQTRICCQTRYRLRYAARYQQEQKCIIIYNKVVPGTHLNTQWIVPYWTRSGKGRLTTRLSRGGGHNLYLNSPDITGILLQNKSFNARSVSLSRSVMRNVGVIFTVIKCVRPNRHCLHYTSDLQFSDARWPSG